MSVKELSKDKPELAAEVPDEMLEQAMLSELVAQQSPLEASIQSDAGTASNLEQPQQAQASALIIS